MLLDGGFDLHAGCFLSKAVVSTVGVAGVSSKASHPQWQDAQYYSRSVAAFLPALVRVREGSPPDKDVAVLRKNAGKLDVK